MDSEWAQKLVAAYGSPLYVYDLDEAERRASELFSLLPDGARLVYSFKANPLPSLAGALREAGCGAELSSVGELRAALEAGFPAEEMLYGGPGKGTAEINAALEAGVRHFSCESWVDLARTEEAARERRQRVSVLLRVNPAVAPQSGLAMAGVPSQFGFEEEGLLSAGDRLRKGGDAVEIAGVHVYFGTQMSGAEAIAEAAGAAIDTAERISGALDLPIRVLDVGGGFPWPYATDAARPDLSGLRGRLAEIAGARRRTADAKLIFESGRYLCASSGTLLATVVDIKYSKGDRAYAVLDAGINHLGGMSGLGRIPRSAISLQRVASGSEGTRQEIAGTLDVVGPLCSPLDMLARNVPADGMKVGDLVKVPNVGAYGLTASLVGFLSRTPPVEVAYRGRSVVSAQRLRSGHELLSAP